MSIGTIVAALALETESDPVAGRALQLARRHEARLVLVHAVEGDLPHEPGLPGSLDAAALKRMLEQDAADRIGRLIGGAPGTATEIVISAGKPHRIIEEVAEREGAGLVVIGPGKARNLREKVFGSTADRIVRSMQRPVLVVRSPRADPYRRLVVAADFSAASQAAAEAALSLAPEAAVELVHAVDTPLAFEQAMRRAGTPQAEIDRYLRARAGEARARISAAFAGTIAAAAARPRLRIVDGPAGAALVRISRSGRADLIALGTQGGNAISQALLGSVARHVLRAAGCDVLVSA